MQYHFYLSERAYIYRFDGEMCSACYSSKKILLVDDIEESEGMMYDTPSAALDRPLGKLVGAMNLKRITVDVVRRSKRCRRALLSVRGSPN